ncbi:MAG: ribosome maturation factor RimP [Elusimicrobiales bacterium]
MTYNTDKIEQALAPLFDQQNMELVDLHIAGHGAKALLQFFIDRKDGKPVSIGDCGLMSDKISAALEMENLVERAYVIEVSSPGVDRALKKPEHFIRFAGQRVKLILRQPVEKRAFFTGVIASADGEKMTLSDAANTYVFSYGDIKSARLDPVLEF